MVGRGPRPKWGMEMGIGGWKAGVIVCQAYSAHLLSELHPDTSSQLALACSDFILSFERLLFLYHSHHSIMVIEFLLNSSRSVSDSRGDTIPDTFPSW